MPVNQVFKGDLIEISMGKETGLVGQGTNVAGGGSATSGWSTANGNTENSSIITIGEAMYWVDTDGHMMVPNGMLIGATLRIYSSGGSNAFTADHFPTTKRTYYITANDDATITVTPRLATNPATANTGDFFIIDSLRVPTYDHNCTAGAVASGGDERVKTDQFLGLLNSFTLPEPEIDVRKQHIIGMGRDVNVLTSGKETLAGGSMDLNAHSLKMWKYALGGHTAKSVGEFAHCDASETITATPLNLKTNVTDMTYAAQNTFDTPVLDTTITAIDNAGTGVAGLDTAGHVGKDVLIGGLTVAAAGATDAQISTAGGNITGFASIFEDAPAAGLFKVLSAAGAPLLGSYTSLANAQIDGLADIDTDAKLRAQTVGVPLYLLAQPTLAVTAGDIRIKLSTTNADKFTLGDYIQIFDKDTVQVPGADVTAPTLNKHEIRRVIGKGSANGQDHGYIYVEEPFLFDHVAASCGVERLQYTLDGTVAHERGSPALLSTGELKNGVEHNFFGYTTLPTFCFEQSFRTTDTTPGTNQMLRVFSGCKVSDLSLTADSEGELKMTTNFEATRMFKDTNNQFITPHRMFENTANDITKRSVSGIAVNGEKPYLFQHMLFSAFGATVLRAKDVNISIANGNTAQFYIRGTDGAYADADQVQEAATQYASEITEAAREYTFTFTALVEDDRFFEELRTRKHNINTNDCTLVLNKPGSAGTRQRGTITLEDYTLMKAEHPMPDDKGPVTASVEFAVRHLKVQEHNPYYII